MGNSFRAVPDIEAHLPAEPRALIRHAVRIPGMNKDYAPASRFTDEQVVEVILRYMRHGTPHRKLAAELGTDPRTVWSWVDGQTRRHCHIEAERRYRNA